TSTLTFLSQSRNPPSCNVSSVASSATTVRKIESRSSPSPSSSSSRSSHSSNPALSPVIRSFTPHAVSPTPGSYAPASLPPARKTTPVSIFPATVFSSYHHSSTVLTLSLPSPVQKATPFAKASLSPSPPLQDVRPVQLPPSNVCSRSFPGPGTHHSSRVSTANLSITTPFSRAFGLPLKPPV
ncbi:hypothetical protein DFH06DRAFT_1052301, partial [Mycena polygramma]